MYSESTLNQIKSQIDIVELVSEYLPLKKSGQGYSGLCPFHQEKTGSFHVHPMKQIFHCFGCHKGGNIFTFVSAVEGLNFPQTVQKLAKKIGYELQEENFPKKNTVSSKAQKNIQNLYKANAWAAKYFHYLLTETSEYAFAKKYLIARGVKEETIKKFQLGVSPKGWSTLLDLLTKRGFKFEELVEAGLIIEKEGHKNKGYDRFRERIMFPITDIEGNKLGFGARLLKDQEGQPKYLNSPESPLFSKRNTLYGIYENQRSVRLKGEAILVEGYMDVVGLYQAGVDNALATMGTALTEEHCTYIKKLTRKVVTVFDPDKSGIEAWHRSVHLFLQAGIFAKDVGLPENQDPDEYALKNSSQKFYELCEKAPRQMTKYLKEVASLGALNEEKRAKVLNEFTPILIASKKLPDRAALWDDISMVLNVSMQSLKELSESGMHNPQSQKNQSPPAKKPLLKPKIIQEDIDYLDLQFFRYVLYHFKDFRQMPLETWESGVKSVTLLELLKKLSAIQTQDLAKTLESCLLEVKVDKLISLISEFMMGSKDNQLKAAEITELFSGFNKRIKEKKIKALTIQVKLSQKMGNSEEQLKLLETLKELRSSSN
jgi:DNA primase